MMLRPDTSVRTVALQAVLAPHTMHSALVMRRAVDVLNAHVIKGQQSLNKTMDVLREAMRLQRTNVTAQELLKGVDECNDSIAVTNYLLNKIFVCSEVLSGTVNSYSHDLIITQDDHALAERIAVMLCVRGFGKSLFPREVSVPHISIFSKSCVFSC